MGAESETAKERLLTLKNNSDGFKIAEKDLEMRGSGDFFGTRQSGKMLTDIKNLRYPTSVIFMAKKLSDEASLDHYTDEDFEIAAGLIENICAELGLEYSIDPSNDSQNEYARVITIKKDGKLIGRINSDAKTDVGSVPSKGWIIVGGILIGAAAIFAIVLVVFVERKKKRTA
jgi:hypothetical protein